MRARRHAGKRVGVRAAAADAALAPCFGPRVKTHRLCLLVLMTTSAALAGAQPPTGTLPNPARVADAPSRVPPPEPLPDGRHAFDFLHGTWRIHNRRLREPLSGSADWYEFGGRSTERPVLGGQGNVEEYDATLPDGTAIRAVALRLYQPATRRWTIHWSNAAAGTLDAPMAGAFRDGVGEFYSHEDYRGRMILVRFRWTHGGPDAARWEQAFSADAGATWETNWVMDFARTGGAASLETAERADGGADARAALDACCPVVELRQYTLHPGAREPLIALFDREFVEPQEATGMAVIAQFRDVDRPDVFTWLRGFPDMPSRAASLGAFYGGPVWARYRDAANGTMTSSDNVRLLRPARPGSGFRMSGARPPVGAIAVPAGLVVATIYTVAAPAAAGFADWFARALTPPLAASGARPIAVFETEPSANTFPRLPVREGEHAFVWFAHFADAAAYGRHAAALAADRRWTDDLRPALAARLAAPVEVWRLTPTARSRTLR